MTKRIVYIDTLRVIAILQVILLHALAHLGTGFTPAADKVSAMLHIFTQFGVSIFFLVSGAMTLGKQESWQLTYKKRFPKIILALIWLPLISVWRATFTGHLWFLHATLMFYALSPLVSAWLRQAGQKQILGVCLTVLALAAINKGWFFLTQSTWIFDNDFLSYFSLYLFGYYLHTYKINCKKWILVIVGLAIVSLELAAAYLGWESEWLTSGVSPLNIVVELILFLLAKQSLLLQNLGDKMGQIIASAGECTFGIYLIHMLVLNLTVPFVWGSFPHLQQYALDVLYKVPTLTAITFLGCWLIVYVARKIPLIRKLL